MTNIPKEEMEVDLIATERDIVCLSTIVESLDIFITQSHGEDRSAWKADRFKYNGLLTQACRLKEKIQSVMADQTEK